MRKARRVNYFKPTVKSICFYAALMGVGIFFGCDKKTDIPSPANQRQVPPIPKQNSLPEIESPKVETTLAVSETLSIEPKLKKVKPRIRIDTLAWVRHPWKWQVQVGGRTDWIPIKIKAPEGMTFHEGALHFTPSAESKEDIHWKLISPKDTGAHLNSISTGYPLKFRLHSLKAVQLEWMTFTGTSLVGDTIVLELHAQWDIRAPRPLRISLQSPGATLADTNFALTAKINQVTRTFIRSGLQRVKAIAWMDSVPVDSVEITISCLAPVAASLQVPKDTLEPGASFYWTIGKPSGNGPFQLSLDVDKDGKMDWTGNQAAKIPWKAKQSGNYIAQLRVTDSKGLTGLVEAPWKVNQSARVKASAKAMKCNRVTPFQLKLEFHDPDDSLSKWFAILPDSSGRLNFPRDTVTLRTLDTQPIHSGKGYMDRKWSIPGKYPVELCAVSSDGRQQCGKLELEVFNAKPNCKITEGLKPVPGKPISLTAKAEDPDGTLVKYEWDLDGDGRYEWQRDSNLTVPFTFARKGKFPISFQVTTADGMTARDSVLMVVKNSW